MNLEPFGSRFCIFISLLKAIGSFPSPHHPRGIHLVVPDDIQECLHHRRIEQDAGLLLQVLAGGEPGPGGAIGAVGQERIVHVDHGEDAGCQGDAVAAQAVGVTGPVPALVVAQGDIQGGAQVLDVGQAVRSPGADGFW